MAGVVRGIVILLAVFAVINAETFQENFFSDENTLNSLENAEDLADGKGKILGIYKSRPLELV